MLISDSCCVVCSRKQNDGMWPTVLQSEEVRAVAAQLLAAHGLGPDAAAALLDEAELRQLCVVARAVPVFTASVLGSYLAQEVLKAVSRAGMPGVNVFVFSAEDCAVKAFPVAVG